MLKDSYVIVRTTGIGERSLYAGAVCSLTGDRVEHQWSYPWGDDSCAIRLFPSADAADFMACALYDAYPNEADDTFEIHILKDL
jgi:hypothetical protein